MTNRSCPTAAQRPLALVAFASMVAFVATTARRLQTLKTPRWLPLLAGLGGLLGAAAVQAQLIDDLELRREGADAVLHIRFVSPVQYLRALRAKSADQSLVFYRLLPTRQVLDAAASGRFLAARPGTTLPGITVGDEPGSGQAADERRLLIRLTRPAPHRARAGRSDRSIEIVLEGLGAQLAPAPGVELPAALQGLLRVTLEATEQAGAFLSAPIPAALQNVNVFTSRRVVNGKVLYETHLGPFASRAEADSALRAVRGRFPQAAVTSEAAPAAPAPSAVAQAARPAPTVAASPPPQAAAAASAPATPPEPAAAAAAVVAAAAASAAAPAAPEPPPVVALAPTAAASAPPATAAPAPSAPPAPPAALAALVPVPAPAPAVALPTPTDAELERQAAALLTSAREALASTAVQTAIDTLSRLLELPPNRSSREAQALIGQARLQGGDTGRARAEFDAFLRLYPAGADSDRVRAALAAMSPQPAGGAAADPRRASTTTLTGSVSSFYYGGQSKVRTQEFQESAIGGLPQLVSDATLSDTDQSQLVSAVDVNWRHRDADVDQRFVFRDSYSKDFNRPDKTRNRLSALYFDQRSFAHGTSFRVGRQSPLGGGVLGRFDGVQAGYAFVPRWKASVVAGVPTDKLLDARRHFYGAAVEAEALTPQLGGSLYAIENKIDGQTDRRAVGSDLRYFEGGLSVSGQLDYDVVLKGLNIASVQGTWQRSDNTVFNVLFDRRKTPMLMLGNTLFFGGLALTPPTRVSDLLDSGISVSTLRQQVRDTTAESTQAALGVTTPVNPQWQVGADFRYTSTGAIAPVADLLPQGQPATGSILSLSLQLIGTNLYSPRDTHVVITNFINGPAFQGQLLSYNNSSLVWPGLQLEPSLKYYRQVSNDNVRSTRWAPGLRLTYRVQQDIALESEVNVESSKTTSPTRNESSTRTFYYLGGRFDF